MTLVASDLTATDIDVFSSEVYTLGIPHEQFAWLRRQRGMLLQQIADPDLESEAFVAARYDDVLAVSKDSEHFTITDGHNVRKVRGRSDAPNLLVLDDPDHLKLRMRANKGFTPKVVRKFEVHYRQLAQRILAGALSNDRFDFVTKVSAELPLAAICELIGAPPEDHGQIFNWSNAIIGTEDGEYSSGLEGRVQASAEMAAYTERLAVERLAAPRDDLLTSLAQATAAGELTQDEFFLYILLLFVAGNETTRNNISHGVFALSQRPEDWKRLAATPHDDPLWDSAVEEITRWATPVIYMSRTCTKSVDVNGQRVEPGQVVAMFYPSANRDEARLRADSRSVRHWARPQPASQFRILDPLLSGGPFGPARDQGHAAGADGPGRPPRDSRTPISPSVELHPWDEAPRGERLLGRARRDR